MPDPAYIGVELESWRITPECRERGVDVAWEDAIARLRQVYDVQLARFPDAAITLTVSIARSTAGAHANPEARS